MQSLLINASTDGYATSYTDTFVLPGVTLGSYNRYGTVFISSFVNEWLPDTFVWNAASVGSNVTLYTDETLLLFIESNSNLYELSVNDTVLVRDSVSSLLDASFIALYSDSDSAVFEIDNSFDWNLSTGSEDISFVSNDSTLSLIESSNSNASLYNVFLTVSDGVYSSSEESVVVVQ